MIKLAVSHIILLLISTAAFAQIQPVPLSDTLAVDSLLISPADTINIEKIISEHKTEIVKVEKPFIVVPWREDQPLGSSVFATDSLLRWQVWPGWGDFQAYRRDVISFRQGTAGRMDAFHINGFLPYEQRLTMEGISLNNPITGLANYNLVPHRKIETATEEFSGNYNSQINLRDYYILNPRSFLNYDESDHNYRNLEFMVAQNITDATNVELSYWDRRDGGNYLNNDVQGSQIFGKVYHHLNDNILLRSIYLRNQFNNNEPFGYVVNDPLAFAFDEFRSSPISSNGVSDFTRWDWVTGIYHRKDTSSTEDAGFEISLSKNNNDLTFSADTIGWNLSSFGGRIFKKLKFNAFQTNAEVDANTYNTSGNSSIYLDNWSTLNSTLDAGFNVGSLLFYGKGSYDIRSDEERGFEVGSGVKGNLGSRFNFHLNAFYFDRIPEIQTKYWQTVNYSGNLNLKNEIGISYLAKGELQLFDRFTFGASWRYKNAKRTAFLSADSIFVNSNIYEQYAATVFGRFESSLLELESSATAQLAEFCCDEADGYLNKIDEIIWLRNSAFVKGYVFDRAAYLKIGIKTLLSPLNYSSRTFNTELQYWQGGSSYSALPPFFRLDAELSARVRSIMVVLRWENALDGMGQAGYFESAGYPMPPRRLIVGIRAQFKN